MKLLRRITLFAVVLTLCAVTSVFVSSAAAKKASGYVNSDEVNIRSGAGTGYSVVANVSKKTPVTVLSGKLYENSWYKIQLEDGRQGYIKKSFLTIKKNQLCIGSSTTGYAGYTRKIESAVNTTGYPIEWNSSDENIAAVDNNGKIKCIAAGSAKITLTAGKKSASFTIRVVNADVSFSQKTAEMYTDDTLTLKVTCGKSVTYASSDTSVAEVSTDGVVTPKQAGKVKITAESRSGSDTCEVTIKKRVITLTADRTKLFTDGMAQLTADGGKYAYTYTSSDTKVLTVDKNGIVKGISAGKAKVTCKSGDLSKSKTFTVKKGSSVNISSTESSVKKYMTLLLKSTTDGVKWRTSNAKIATVDSGFVLGVSKGTAIITAYTSSGEKSCVVSVKAAEPVRFVYTSENSAYPGESVTFYAITDTSRTDVQFKITDPDGKTTWLKSPAKQKKDGRLVWSKSKKLSVAGVHTIIAYSRTKFNATWKTCSGGSGETFVSPSKNQTTVSFGTRRASTKLINNIASFEGFWPNVQPDTLAGGIPTVGYGRVVYAGTTFYNGLTKDEAYAYLVKTINDSGYTTNVNKILKDNKIKFNQSHFDALLDFAYNLGPYAITNHEELIGTLQNSYGSSANKNKAFVNVLSAPLRSEASESSKSIKSVKADTTVTLVKKSGSFYKVRLDDGTEGFIKTAQLTGRSTDTTVRNLKNVKLKTFLKNFLPYHHASGNCYYGLLYRRVDEAEMFFFNDYTANGKQNNFGFSYSCSKNSSFGIG